MLNKFTEREGLRQPNKSFFILTMLKSPSANNERCVYNFLDLGIIGVRAWLLLLTNPLQTC